MAASDPTPGVPTPTGTLQGVAAFAWDGTTWQPAAGAGPDVATPTGVLRGVAPFSWDGAAWQPAGRAQPGVAAPGGVLDGVAVYTWSGAAWTPASGQPTPSTPSGSLRGVAAFTWDGAAWQPAGRAGPSVATPTGVLDGVAMFNWTGTAWTPAPSLALNFMTPGSLDPRITLIRASTATYFDVTGTMQTAAVNVPRWDYDPVTHLLRGLLIEEQRTNLLLNSATLGTQSVAVTAQAYTLSFYGAGTITKSGAAAGALVGTGAFPQRVSQTFTPSAGTLTLTVTGSVLNAQLEAGQFATSYIPTVGAAGTRIYDNATMPTTGWLNAAQGSVAAHFTYEGIPTTGNPNWCIFALDDGGGNRANAIDLFGFVNGNTFVQPNFNINVASASAGSIAYANLNFSGLNYAGFAASWNATTSAVSANGGAAQTGVVTGLPTLSRLSLGQGYGGAGILNGWLRDMRYWPRVLSNAEMQAVTT